MSDYKTENARTLAALLNVAVEEAAQLLDIAIAVTADPTDEAAMVIGWHLERLLGRTIARVHMNRNAPTDAIAGEVVIGAATPTRPDALRVHVTPEIIQIAASAPATPVPADTHGVLLLVAACYATGAILKAVFGERLQVPAAMNGLSIPVCAIIGNDPVWLTTDFQFANTYLAGAGAIGNGFLYALSLLKPAGSLVIADPDVVSDGNLNRCLWFTTADLNLPKARRLAELAQPYFPRLQLIPQEKTLQQVGKEQTTNAWLKRLIAAVDSRRTRRRLQYEIPGEVFDASTTGALECVFHHHVQPTDNACLACIYHEIDDELVRERHVAETLGVDVDDVKQHYVSVAAARQIHARYPHVPVERLEGQAYDTLFKALCSEGMLLAPDHRQVLAPFAFVSVLAGTYLAIECARRLVLGPPAHDFNYWRISPWQPPVPELKQIRSRNDLCEFCREPVFHKTASALWHPMHTVESVR